jgi:hypothetical protein
MTDLKCPFANPLISRDFGCAHAHAITRRGGPDIGCDSATASADCGALFKRLKAAGLPAFGVPDDPTQMPYSVLLKLQYGGLLGLKVCLDGQGAERVENVFELLARAKEAWGRIEAIPAESWTDQMTGFKVRRRRGKRGSEE